MQKKANRPTLKSGTANDSWWGGRLSGHTHAMADPREPLRPFLSVVGQVSLSTMLGVSKSTARTKSNALLQCLQGLLALSPHDGPISRD